jgi:hypothetical protein
MVTRGAPAVRGARGRRGSTTWKVPVWGHTPTSDRIDPTSCTIEAADGTGKTGAAPGGCGNHGITGTVGFGNHGIAGTVG